MRLYSALVLCGVFLIADAGNGGDPMVLDSGIGFCIPAGSVVGLELHCVTKLANCGTD